MPGNSATQTWIKELASTGPRPRSVHPYSEKDKDTEIILEH